MKRTRLRTAALATLVVSALAILTIPTATGGYDSATEALIRNLHRRLLVVAIPLGIIVEAALFYAALKFHGNDDPKPTEENRDLEIAWTIGVAIILLFVGASSYLVLADPMVSTVPDATPHSNDVHVEVTGQNWYWNVSYPGQNVTTQNLLVLPTNRTIFFTITSKDVIHSVHIPGLGVKQDAIPGQTNHYRTRLRERGTYRLYCAEYCGAGHSKMIAVVKVVSEDEYQQWIRQQREETETQNRSSSRSAMSRTNLTPQSRI